MQLRVLSWYRIAVVAKRWYFSQRSPSPLIGTLRIPSVLHSRAAKRADACSGIVSMTSEAAKEIEVPTSLDKSLFDEEISVLALQVPKQRCHEYMKSLSKYLLNKPRLQNVKDAASSPDSKLLLLSTDYTLDDLPEPVLALKEKEDLTLVPTTVHVDYSYWPAPHVLKRLLPEGMEVPSAFETIGHIAHLNLREDALPWKHIIGQVLLEKNVKLRTIVNKLGSIDNEYRVFDMEVIAGEEDTVTEVQQQGHRFQLDFRKVYWNSRLEREHTRLVTTFAPGQVILDVMAGIGPFAVPAAARDCTVYANDLNPDSHTFLCKNIQRNRVTERAFAFNMDGAAFIREAAAGRLAPAALPPLGAAKRPVPSTAVQESEPTQRLPFHHVIMNLPASAVEFCSAFRSAFPEELWEAGSLPKVHVYAFAKGVDCEPGDRGIAGYEEDG
uniref:tRNA (guanine(37)-N1)-methyltransferase n=1 Tax=Auxenochlorella protothecoides TaxID=3075 RepID=A0A1D1ZW67_AUXPR